MDGWVDGLKGVKASLRIAYSNRKEALALGSDQMRSNRPQAKFHSKSDSNSLLINFFDINQLFQYKLTLMIVKLTCSVF